MYPCYPRRQIIQGLVNTHKHCSRNTEATLKIGLRVHWGSTVQAKIVSQNSVQTGEKVTQIVVLTTPPQSPDRGPTAAPPRMRATTKATQHSNVRGSSRRSFQVLLVLEERVHDQAQLRIHGNAVQGAWAR